MRFTDELWDSPERTESRLAPQVVIGYLSVIALVGVIVAALVAHALQQQPRITGTKTVTVHTVAQATFWHWALVECPQSDTRQIVGVIARDNPRISAGALHIGTKLTVPVC